MTAEVKMRQCLKCRQSKPEFNFQRTPSNFFPGHRSYICTSCLETMIDQSNLGEVDRYEEITFLGCHITEFGSNWL